MMLRETRLVFFKSISIFSIKGEAAFPVGVLAEFFKNSAVLYFTDKNSWCLLSGILTPIRR